MAIIEVTWPEDQAQLSEVIPACRRMSSLCKTLKSSRLIVHGADFMLYGLDRMRRFQVAFAFAYAGVPGLKVAFVLEWNSKVDLFEDWDADHRFDLQMQSFATLQSAQAWLSE